MALGGMVVGGLGLLLLGYVLGSRGREGRDLMAPPRSGLTPRMGVAPTLAGAPPAQSQLSPEVRGRIAAALRAGDKIAAIKLYRQATGTDLKSAKQAVEAMV